MFLQIQVNFLPNEIQANILKLLLKCICFKNPVLLLFNLKKSLIEVILHMHLEFSTTHHLKKHFLPKVAAGVYIKLPFTSLVAQTVKQMVKHLPTTREGPGSISESGRSSGEGNGIPLQYSCLENPMDRGAW